MSNISPLNVITNLKSVAIWMHNVIKAYESGAIPKKTASALSKRTLKKFSKYIPNPEERENYDKLLDLFSSLSTVDRADGNFEKFYLGSLKEELDTLLESLEVA
ncbi:MAG: hypothetical protein KGD64_13565 [Candidatus Heimdallarchaeota archaeon]|nr:hypothetical protein [Candidatus Heimdallarchaeota archaeon]